ncbi:phenylacetate--CoA ligase family protein [Methanosarcina sp. T3]|uniref:phenylacetate--CoA ligase family protein n=1 Tax=Methanosarcina sp. T3 TaxID=3439062 RepID=UPI003F8795CE
MKQQWLKPEELEAIQVKMLRAMLKHAYTNVPLYHDKFRSVGVYPDDIKCVEDLQKLPLTTKKEVQENFPRRILSPGTDLSKCWVSQTSGSTGIPSKMVYGTRDEDYQKAVALRPNLGCGQKIRDRWAVFTSPSHVVGKKWFQKLQIFAPEFVSLFDKPDDQIQALKQINPDVIDGYASSIYLVAKRLQETGTDVIHPRLVFSTSELLTQDMRRCIETTFGVDVLDQFGCVELGRTAWECHEHAGYHIDSDVVVMEFLREGSAVAPGERGEIAYTGLYNYTMPLIRYSVGDVGVLSDETCPCGRGLPLMKLIEGRSDAFMKAPNGQIFSPIIWTVLMRGIPGIGQFKVIQERIDLLKVLVVKGLDFSEATIPQIQRDIKAAMGEEMEVDVDIVEEIPRSPSGKVRCAVSKVPVPL